MGSEQVACDIDKTVLKEYLKRLLVQGKICGRNIPEFYIIKTIRMETI